MDKIATLVVRIPREIKRLAEDAADEKGITVSRWIQEMIVYYTKEQGK
jgi:antitoxin component of RelBE/YafQ-DinJ toxin-antitoxin module